MAADATANIIYQATAATVLVKAGVDLIKIGWGGDGGRTPMWVPPVASLISGLGIMALLGISNGQDLMVPAVAAQTALAGIMAAVSAVGVTELHKIARPQMEPRAGEVWAGTSASPGESGFTTSYSPRPSASAGPLPLADQLPPMKRSLFG